jgi:hypothetical protein
MRLASCFAVSSSKLELDSERISMTTRSFYVEVIDRFGTEAKWWHSLPDVASACSTAREKRSKDEFVRIIPPVDPSPDEWKQLNELGIIPTEQFIPPPR